MATDRNDMRVPTLQPHVDYAQMIRKLRAIADHIDRGLLDPDHLQVAWAAGVLKELGELELSARYERLARRLMPMWARDLT